MYIIPKYQLTETGCCLASLGSMKNYTIRTEQPRDFKTVENLTREAFWNVYRPGCTEHYVLHCYRSEPDFVPELSLVLEVDGEIVGHVMYAWSHIDAEPYFVAMRNPEAFEKYDAEFPPKEKLVLPGQLG